MNLNSNNGNENFIRYKQPRLLRVARPPETTAYEQANYDFEQKNIELRKRIHELNKYHRQNKDEQDKFELNRMLTCFYKNPFNYMEYLAKRYFIENANTLENLKIKQEMTSNFQKLCNQIEGQIRNYTTNEERKLNELHKMVENKLKNDALPFDHDIPNDYQGKDDSKNVVNNNNQNIGNNLESSPMTVDDREFINRVLGNFGSYGTSMDGITTKGNAANYVINNKVSNLNEDNIYRNALSCLKGDKLVVPKNKFIAVKELTLDDINEKKIKDTQNISDLKNKMKIDQYNNQILGRSNDENDKKIKNKINNMKKNEKKNLEDLISYSNNAIRNMEQIQKEKKDLINTLKRELNQNYEKKAIELALQKLSICEKSLSQYKNVDNNINHNNNIPEISLIDWKKRKEMLDKEYNDTQTKVDNFLKGRGASLSKPIKTKKSKNKKIKRNKSAHPYSILKK
jgi:hypothetical protein